MPSYVVLARKYRPSTFSDVVGQDHVIRTLSNSILSGRVAHAFLFCGVRGVGKTTVARILAKSLNCSGRQEGDPNPCNQCTSCKEITAGISVDVQEIDGASHTSVENIREINENIKYPPVSSPYKIIIIDEVHMISINAFNALLKTLEEPPPHAKFMFATTEAHKVPATINSRCQRFNFRTISVKDIIGGMERILAQEGIDATEDALAMVATEAQGSFRDALSLLDQVISFGSDHIGADDVAGILGIAGRDSFGKLAAAILERDPPAALGLLHELFQRGYDPEQFVLDMIQYMRNLIVVRAVPAERRLEGMIDAPKAEIDQMEQLAQRASPEELQNLFGMLLRSEGEIKRSSNPWIAVEMAILRMSYAPEIVNLAEILRRMESQGGTTGPKARGPLHTPAAARKTVRESDQPVRTPSPPVEMPKDAASPPPPVDSEQVPSERFTITKITPLPTGTPDEMWAKLKDTISKCGMGPALPSIMDHGSLISFGPTEVEIGFHKAIYRDEFERVLENKPDLARILREFFGDAHIKILTLANETSLRTDRPYEKPEGGGTDLERALKGEAIDNKLVKAILGEFDGSYIEEIEVTPGKH